MSKISIKQGRVSVIVSDICYSPVSSGIEDETPYVIDEFLSATVDQELKNGDALLCFAGQEHAVILAVGGFVEDLEDDEDPIFELELEPVDGSLPRLADALGLLANYTPSQKKALFGDM